MMILFASCRVRPYVGLTFVLFDMKGRVAAPIRGWWELAAVRNFGCCGGLRAQGEAIIASKPEDAPRLFDDMFISLFFFFVQ